MAKQKAKGSIVYEVLIVILIAILVATILYPRTVWKNIEKETILCRDQMNRIVDAEGLFISFHESYNFDTSLVHVVSFVRNDSIFGLDSVRTTLRDSFYVKLIIDYLRDYQDVPTKVATDSAYQLVRRSTRDSLVAVQVDTIVDLMFNRLFTCPTDNDTYRIEVVDTSAIKVLKVFCPLDSTELDSMNRRFWFRVIGGGKVKNHGSIDNGKPSWEPMKRK